MSLYFAFKNGGITIAHPKSNVIFGLVASWMHLNAIQYGGKCMSVARDTCRISRPT